ncbi:MAG: EscU/YscU/HrcU family type III secretion system export apparatus switch protein, partial [Candidatus Berkiella sp.]
MIVDTQERTEQATPKKEKESKERGLVARSKDFNSFVVLFFGCVSFIVFGKYIVLKSQRLFKDFFSFDPQMLSQDNALLLYLKNGLTAGIYILLPMAILILIASLVGAY